MVLLKYIGLGPYHFANDISMVAPQGASFRAFRTPLHHPEILPEYLSYSKYRLIPVDRSKVTI